MEEPAPPARSRLGRRLLGLTVGCGALAALFLVLGDRLTARAAEGRVYRRVNELPVRSVGIVPGALVLADGSLSATLYDRVLCAAALYRAHKVKRLLVSGNDDGRGYDEVSAMRAALLDEGVPASDIMLDRAGYRTLDTMQRAREVFGVRDAILCTQRFHLPRSLFLADRFGVRALGLAADRRRYRTETFNAVREALARALAVFDTAVGREARRLDRATTAASD